MRKMRREVTSESWIVGMSPSVGGLEQDRRSGAPERIRTTNLLIRSQMLYPVELRAQNSHLPSKIHANAAVSCCLATEKFRSKIRSINFGSLLVFCYERSSAFVSCAWTKILPRTAAAAGRALLYSFRAAVKPTNPRP